MNWIGVKLENLQEEMDGLPMLSNIALKPNKNHPPPEFWSLIKNFKEFNFLYDIAEIYNLLGIYRCI